MQADITIVLPVPPAIFAIFVGILVLAALFYGIKFVASLIVGG